MKQFIKENKTYIKSILIVLIGQALSYFILKTLINNFNLLTPKINFPLIKEFVIIYNSWYPFIFYTSFLIYKKDQNLYKKLIYTFLISIIISHITFIIYPTQIERPVIETRDFSSWLLNITYFFDTPAVNCVPSIHCLLCFITFYYITLTKNIKTKVKILINTYLILIILSTLFTHQHYLIDALIALIYTIIGIIITKFAHKKLKRVPIF